MPFSSLLEFDKWHKSIQRHCDYASLQPGDKTGAGCYLPLSHFRCDDGPRQPQQMVKRDVLSLPSVLDEFPLQPSSPTLSKKEAD